MRQAIRSASCSTRLGRVPTSSPISKTPWPSAKANARHLVASWLSRLDGDQPQPVRVNGSPRLLVEDVRAVVGPAVTGICLPKTQGPEQLGSLGELLGVAERQAGLAEGASGVVALVESAAGLLSARAIAEQPRVWQLGLGELDLCAEFGLQPSADERELLSIRVQVVLASAAAGLALADWAVSTDFRDLDGCGIRPMPFAVLGSAADGRSIPPRCRSSTRSSRPQQTRWRRRGILWSAMTVRSTRGRGVRGRGWSDGR